jgi:hypothetical protein
MDNSRTDDKAGSLCGGLGDMHTIYTTENGLEAGGLPDRLPLTVFSLTKDSEY